jgi:hypothetical protein
VLPLLYRALGPRRLRRIAAAMTTDNREARKLIAEMIEAFDPAAGRAIAEQVRHYDLVALALGFDGPILLVRAAATGR